MTKHGPTVTEYHSDECNGDKKMALPATIGPVVTGRDGPERNTILKGRDPYYAQSWWWPDGGRPCVGCSPDLLNTQLSGGLWSYVSDEYDI